MMSGFSQVACSHLGVQLTLVQAMLTSFMSGNFEEIAQDSPWDTLVKVVVIAVCVCLSVGLFFCDSFVLYQQLKDSH